MVVNRYTFILGNGGIYPSLWMMCICIPFSWWRYPIPSIYIYIYKSMCSIDMGQNNGQTQGWKARNHVRCEHYKSWFCLICPHLGVGRPYIDMYHMHHMLHGAFGSTPQFFLPAWQSVRHLNLSRWKLMKMVVIRVFLKWIALNSTGHPPFRSPTNTGMVLTHKQCALITGGTPSTLVFFPCGTPSSLFTRHTNT